MIHLLQNLHFEFLTWSIQKCSMKWSGLEVNRHCTICTKLCGSSTQYIFFCLESWCYYWILRLSSIQSFFLLRIHLTANTTDWLHDRKVMSAASLIAIRYRAHKCTTHTQKNWRHFTSTGTVATNNLTIISIWCTKMKNRFFRFIYKQLGTTGYTVRCIK